MIGAGFPILELNENRQQFSEIVDKAGLKPCRSRFASSFQEADEIRKELGNFPVVLRSCFTRNAGVQIVRNEKELYQLVLRNIELSKFRKVRIEECLEGRKEIEIDVLRDDKGNAAVVSAMENVDPVGIHSDDSVIVSPPQTLTSRQFKRLKESAVKLEGEWPFVV